jgi:DNA-3-methyladenine glycosylase
MSTEVIPPSFFARDVEQVARDLLGSYLHARSDNGVVVGKIVETEAYGGPEDLASHAAFRKSGYVKYMWGPPGTLYVYKAYGVYPCFNVVTGDQGEASAVLLRALEIHTPEFDNTAASGPGRLGRVIGLKTAHNGHLLTEPPFWFSPREDEPERISTGVRVGVKRGEPHNWRFAIPGHPAVSRPKL